MPERITVTSAQLASAITVWLKVMPKRIWRDLEKHKLAELERRQGDCPKVERAVAEHVTASLKQAGWEVSRVELPSDQYAADYVPGGMREDTDSGSRSP